VLGAKVAGDVLLLDDDCDLLDSVAELIESATGRRVWKARSLGELTALGEQALRSELAILDINLGTGVPSGLDALRWLGERRFPGRVIFLTGHAHTFPLVEEARRTEGIQVLSKPIGSPQLLALLERP
jgi:FixJ family two-component response regulator